VYIVVIRGSIWGPIGGQMKKHFTLANARNQRCRSALQLFTLRQIRCSVPLGHIPVTGGNIGADKTGLQKCCTGWPTNIPCLVFFVLPITDSTKLYSVTSFVGLLGCRPNAAT